MKKFILKILLLVFPLLVYVSAILLIDPFNYYAFSDFVTYSIKRNAAYSVNPVLFNLLEFKRNPSSSITISDSRFAQKNLQLIEEKSGLKFSEVFVFDGMIKDIISGFWFANSQIHLKNVYISVSFNNFYVSQRNDLVKSADVVIKDPLLYFFNLNVINAAYKCISLKYDNSNYDSTSVINFDKMSFWNDILIKTKNRFYLNYSFPQEYIAELKEIADYCKVNNINLYFVVPPTSIDLQNLIHENGLTDKKEKLLSELSGIAKTYNLDFVNPITSNRELYYDPNHLNKDTLSYIFTLILNKNSDSINEYVR